MAGPENSVFPTDTNTVSREKEEGQLYNFIGEVYIY